MYPINLKSSKFRVYYKNSQLQSLLDKKLLFLQITFCCKSPTDDVVPAQNIALQLPVDKLKRQLGGAQPQKKINFLHQLMKYSSFQKRTNYEKLNLQEKLILNYNRRWRKKNEFSRQNYFT